MMCRLQQQSSKTFYRYSWEWKVVVVWFLIVLIVCLSFDGDESKYPIGLAISGRERMAAVISMRCRFEYANFFPTSSNAVFGYLHSSSRRIELWNDSCKNPNEPPRVKDPILAFLNGRGLVTQVCGSILQPSLTTQKATTATLSKVRKLLSAELDVEELTAPELTLVADYLRDFLHNKTEIPGVPFLVNPDGSREFIPIGSQPDAVVESVLAKIFGGRVGVRLTTFTYGRRILPRLRKLQAQTASLFHIPQSLLEHYHKGGALTPNCEGSLGEATALADLELYTNFPVAATFLMLSIVFAVVFTSNLAGSLDNGLSTKTRKRRQFTQALQDPHLRRLMELKAERAGKDPEDLLRRLDERAARINSEDNIADERWKCEQKLMEAWKNRVELMWVGRRILLVAMGLWVPLLGLDRSHTTTLLDTAVVLTGTFLGTYILLPSCPDCAPKGDDVLAEPLLDAKQRSANAVRV